MVVSQVKMRYEDPFDVDAFINSLLFLKKYPGKNVSTASLTPACLHPHALYSEKNAPLLHSYCPHSLLCPVPPPPLCVDNELCQSKRIMHELCQPENPPPAHSLPDPRATPVTSAAVKPPTFMS